MTYEAVKVELYDSSTGSPRRYTVADGTAITKGTLLKLADPRTASAANAASIAAATYCAGIAAEEKEASDGQTSLGVWTNGVFECYASGAIVAGEPIVFIVDNHVARAVAVASGAIIAGYALETATTGEVINVRINL
jgi:hypothetical protein